jgi:transposase
MPIEKFLPLYMAAAESGMTKEEFATKIGVKPETVYQRVYELRRAGLADDIPLLRTEGRVPKIERAREILKARLGGGKVAKAEKPKAKPAKVEAAADEPVLEKEDGTEEDELANIFG